MKTIKDVSVDALSIIYFIQQVSKIYPDISTCQKIYLLRNDKYYTRFKNMIEKHSIKETRKEYPFQQSGKRITIEVKVLNLNYQEEKHLVTFVPGRYLQDKSVIGYTKITKI